MSYLDILTYPDQRLRTIARSVEQINSNIKNIIKNMFFTMYMAQGIGLSATQVNIHLCIVVIDISENKNNKIVLINPKIIEKSGQAKIEEGCLSIPGYRAVVPRAERVRVSATNIYGNKYELYSEGLLAVCIQHEVDHLFGKLFIDYLPYARN